MCHVGVVCVPWGPIWGVSDALFLGLLPLIGVRTKSGFSLGAPFGGGGGGSKGGQKSDEILIQIL